ncbi:uncharacterized protein LOC136084618 isoform X1 [Hydra vulgaris]|uniref:uncharacterized protein LOC136084618 isoform X1 n=1 Tax=Hydra vulgaris TaxID=6087 RepID=UPI0032E9D21A
MRAIKILIDKRKLLGTSFKKIKEVWKNMGSKLTAFFQKQKKVLQEWWNKKKKDKNLVNEYSDKITEFFKKEGTADNTKDIVENTISLTKAIRTVKLGFDPGDALNGIQTDGFNNNKFATVQEALDYFKHPGVNEAIDLGQNLSSVDVLKWAIAKEHVDGMMETTLSDDVPEATTYRTALLKLITTGETRTQATLDQAVLETSFSASCFAWKLYASEGISIGEEIQKTEENLNDDNKISDEDLQDEIKKSNSSLHLDIEWEQLAIKLELVHLNKEYCNAYYYFHLEKCEDDLRINPSDDLEKILSIQNILLYQSNSKLQNLFPPPQTFTDLTILIEQPKYCKCFESFMVKKNYSEKNIRRQEDINERNSDLEALYESVKRCLTLYLDYNKLKENTVTTKEHTKNEGSEKLKERKLANNLLDNCINSRIENVKKSRQFVYKVDIDSPDFIGHERVRIDEVKVIFKGVKTTNGIVKIYAESTGISEDRYKDQCYKFIGDRWIRLLSYYSKSSISNKDKIDIIQKKDVAGSLVQMLEKELFDQVTFIDTANIHKKY